MNQQKPKIVECPRDAMQGIHDFIATEDKVRYINQLLKVGFDTIDFGSFVSPKAIPQLKDTAKVLEHLELPSNGTKLLAIVANQRGAESAINYESIDYLGYPFSVSETFQQRNTNASIEESLGRVEDIQNLVLKNNKSLVLYLSMGFGNPYGDPYHEDIVAMWIEKLAKLEISVFALSDTIGIAQPDIIERLFSTLIPAYEQLQIGAHLHTTADTWKEKVESAYRSGCRRFDGAIEGFGGCPMAADELTGNMPTENLLSYFDEVEQDLDINMEAFMQARLIAGEIFPL